MKIGKAFIDSSSSYARWKVWVYLPDGSRQRMYYSRLVVEMILKDILPLKAVVHHIGDTLDDSPQNLVICEDEAYHKLLHIRTDAYRATGNAHARRCNICQQWDIPGENDMMVYFRKGRPTGSGQSRHKSCYTKRYRK